MRLSDHADIESAGCQASIDVLSPKICRQHSLVLEAPPTKAGATSHPIDLALSSCPPNPPPELNPKENLWDEIREKIFKNYALKSIDAVRAKLKQAILISNAIPKS